MRWFEGSIPEAVSSSKKKNAIFVVFVEGENDLSVEMSSTVDSPVVLKQLSDENKFLAVKLKSGSVDYTHFAQLYQFVPVPSLFFIGHNGTPLEVVCAGVQPDDLARRIDRILEQHLKDKPAPTQPQMQPSTSSEAMRQAAAQLIHSEAANVQGQSGKHPEETENPLQPAQKIQKTDRSEAEAAKCPDPKPAAASEEYEVVCDGDVCVRKPRVKAPGGAGPSTDKDEVSPNQVAEEVVLESQEDINAKVEKARKLLEARQREKDDHKKEEEKRKELERRATGQGVAELKKWQEEQEMKQIQEERKREKLENDLARQRILAQIAQDRAERKARDAQPQTEPGVVDNTPLNTTTGDSSRATRIQFKLPDGASHTAHFAPDGTLADVHRYVADNLQLSQSNFSLWTAFPRRELNDADATLHTLQLTPSAALLVLPRRTANTVSRPTPFASFITFLTQFLTSFVYQPTMNAVEWVRSRVFPRPPSTSSSTPINPGVRPNVRPTQRTNVHRLHGDRASDDENNTWNGNSTQQM